MSLFDDQLETLRRTYEESEVTATRLPSGAHLIEVRGFHLPDGWNREQTTLIFVAPPGFPMAQPDCFWAEPAGLRLKDGATPQNTNDANPIPEVGPRGTWFSWHVQQWNPNADSLVSYIRVIERRLDPPR